MIATTKQGAIGAWQASSLPNNSGYATIAATSGDPLVMTKMHHKGDPTLYDAIGVNMTAAKEWKTGTEVLNPYQGELDEQGNVIKGTENPNYNTMFATGIEIHSAWDDVTRGSHGCQTIKPGVKYGNGSKKYGKGPTWLEFQKTMKLSSYKDNAFIGYYYLIKP